MKLPYKATLGDWSSKFLVRLSLFGHPCTVVHLWMLPQHVDVSLVRAVRHITAAPHPQH